MDGALKPMRGYKPFINFKVLPLLALSVFGCIGVSFAALNESNTLQKPDVDVKRFFPQYTHYRARNLIPAKHGTEDLFEKIEKEFHKKLDLKYERWGTSHTFYIVYRNDLRIGLIHGNNVQISNGLLQVFVVYDAAYTIKDIYVQKIASHDAHSFRSKYYRKQYNQFGINALPDWAYIHPPVRAPSNNTITDHRTFVDAVMVNVLFVKHLFLPYENH